MHRRAAGRGRSAWMVYVTLACVLVALPIAWRALQPPAVVILPPSLYTGMVNCTLPTPGEAEDVGAGGFWLDCFEVTEDEYRAFAEATGRPPLPSASPAFALARRGQRTAEWPATRVTLLDARAYAVWVRKRLPTADEWQTAAFGLAPVSEAGDGVAEDEVANTVSLRLGHPSPVGTFHPWPRRAGLYDLLGNVAEWTETRAGESSEPRYRVVGGSYLDPTVGPGTIAPTAAPLEWSNVVGFRCALDRAAKEDDDVWRAALGELGHRDPLHVVLFTRPAEALLRAAGARVRPLLVVTLGLNRDRDGLVVKRLEALLAPSYGDVR